MSCGQNNALVAKAARWVWALAVTGVCFAAGDAPLPEDLGLSKRDLMQAEALARFAWGLHLQMGSRDGFEAAAEHYREAVRLQPEATLPLRHLIAPYAMQKRYDLLVAQLAPIVRDHPSLPHLNLAYAEALHADQREAEALEHLQRTLAACNWREPAVLRALFLSLWRDGRFADCDRLLQRARRQPALRDRFEVEHASAVFYAAMRHAEGSDKPSPRQAQRLEKLALNHARNAAAKAALDTAPEDLRGLAALLLDLGDASTAAATLARHRTEATEDESPDPELLLLEAKALQEDNRQAEAAALVDRLREFGGLGLQIYPDMADVYADAGKLAAAAEVYEDALTRFPNATAVRFQLALTYLRLDQPKRGLAVLLPLKQISPQGQRLMAHLYFALDRKDLALEELQKAEEAALVSRDQTFFNPDLYLFAGTLCEDLGKTELAIQYARKALAMAPDDPSTCNFLGYILADHNQSLTEAEQLILRAVAAEPDNDAYLDSLAWVYYRQNRLPEAHEAMNRAIRAGMESLDGVILDHGGDICLALGLAELATWYWEEALRAGVPGTEIVQAKLDRLRAGTPQVTPTSHRPD
jgi:tetratricopeptide (TPR) repeat protein